MKKSQTPSPPRATNAELDILAVVYQGLSEAQDDSGMRLAEIHDLVCARRKTYNEPPPKLTTVSTQLRGLVDKGLLTDEPAKEAEASSPAPARSRGMFASRSAPSAFRPNYTLAELLRDRFIDLAEVYPENRPYQALIDFAKAVELPKDQNQQGEALIKFAKALGMPRNTIKRLESFIDEVSSK